MAGEAAPLPAAVVRSLSDKLYEKRRVGAVEVEEIVKELAANKERERICHIIHFLAETFAQSTNANSRKGGLLSLAAIAIALATTYDDAQQLLPLLIAPVLKCFQDADSRVRYYACESMYNIAKAGRRKIMPFFNDIFDGLCKLVADPDANVKSGAQLLDRLMKDIVTEPGSFDVPQFVSLLKERVCVNNPFVRQFLISWIQVLNSVPDVDIVACLPLFLGGLFRMLSDAKKDIRREAENCLADFLTELHTYPALDHGAHVAILLDFASQSDQLTRLTAISWINEFILIGKTALLPFSTRLVASILPSLSHESSDIREEAAKANDSLLALVEAHPDSAPMPQFLHEVVVQFKCLHVPTRLAALNWVLVLHLKAAHRLTDHLDHLFLSLVLLLRDVSDEVVRLALEALAKVAASPDAFKRMMRCIVNLLADDAHLLETRAALIVKQLTLFICPLRMYHELAGILEEEEDLPFASVLVQTLNLILMTAGELRELRARLKGLADTEACDLFLALYRSWSHNATATLSLCLLAQVYEHASDLVTAFADLEVSVAFLVEVDKLIRLLESPIFASLRLQLLEPAQYPHLYKCLYGLLMLLPQSSAFDTLRNRLACIGSSSMLHSFPPSKQGKTVAPPSHVDFAALLKHFCAVQEKHSALHKKVHMDTLRGVSKPKTSPRIKSQ